MKEKLNLSNLNKVQKEELKHVKGGTTGKNGTVEVGVLCNGPLWVCDAKNGGSTFYDAMR